MIGILKIWNNVESKISFFESVEQGLACIDSKYAFNGDTKTFNEKGNVSLSVLPKDISPTGLGLELLEPILICDQLHQKDWVIEPKLIPLLQAIAAQRELSQHLRDQPLYAINPKNITPVNQEIKVQQLTPPTYTQA